MARPSVAARNLSLTEELERLEQSITLTLQEIDHNFSKSHRIVTTSILPLVEQYGENSRAVWEASKASTPMFWKQFFEASANVSLSGYEELANDGESTVVDDSSAMRDDASVDYTARQDDENAAAPGTHTGMAGDESLLDDAELTGSTPRPPATKVIKKQFANLESPYEAMKREMKGEEGETGAGGDPGDDTTVLRDDDEEDSTVIFARRTAQLPDMSMTPKNALEDKMRAQQQSGGQKGQRDPLLHRVLEKNYRVQATPHKPAYRVSPLKQKDEKQRNPAAWEDSPMSSPEVAIPTLRSEAFMSPFKRHTAAAQRLAAAAAAGGGGGPRTPGVSVQTPGAGGRKTRDAFATDEAGRSTGKAAGGKQKYEIDYESDEDEDDLYAGMSPPKTIQFALPPSKLLQTPAREASKRIVEDILLDAGADPESSEYSPTMVKMNQDILDDSF